MLCFACRVVSQDGFDLSALNGMSAVERCRAALQPGLRYVDSATFVARYGQLWDLAQREHDRKAQWVLTYHRFKNRIGLKLTPDQIFAALSDLKTIAAVEKWPVESIVAQHYWYFENFAAKKIGPEQLYAYILDEFSRMQERGLARFVDYEVPDLMYHSAKFMFDLEDHDKALQFLLAGEPFMRPMKTRHHTLVLTLNYLQTIYQQRKEYPLAIQYARKILQATDSIRLYDPKAQEFCYYWQGLATIDIASMLIQQQKFAEGEQFADQGYALTTSFRPKEQELLWEGEFDALLPLFFIKLELKKMAEAEGLLQRADDIWKQIGHKEVNHFKAIRLWQAHARLAETKGDFAASVRYERLANALQDSLDRRNDARKLEKIRQRVEAQKYVEQINLIEREKQIQSGLLKAALVLLLLVVLLAYHNYRRLQRNRQQTAAALEAAQKELETHVQNLLEKSELAEKLRLEIAQFSAKGERNGHLQDLLQSTILTEADWVRFRAVFEKVHPDFIAEQKAMYPDLTQSELRYLVLEKLQLNTHEMAQMLGVSDGTVRQTRSRLRKKTNL